MEILTAKSEHAAKIAEIWSYYIRETIATFNSVEKTTQEIEAMIAEKSKSDEPCLIAMDDGEIVGFATYGPFRSGVGYARVKEHTIQLIPSAKARGYGRALMAALEDHARARNIQSLFAGISGENSAAVKFHQAIGYSDVCTIEKVGWKFDRWHDLKLMRKHL